MKMFVGLHQPNHATHFERCMISVNRLRARRSRFAVGEWMMDSAAFTELYRYGHYRHGVEEYAAEIRRWRACGQLLAASTQDFMCERFILDRTGLTIKAHQSLTIERYDALLAENTGVYILPVVQGYRPDEYVAHLGQYGARLAPGAWVGVGSVCKRNANVAAIEGVLIAIKDARPDLRLHGFGLKTTALRSSIVRSCLYSADSMAWSWAARRQGRNANDWREAADFLTKIETQKVTARAFQYSFLDLI